MAVSYKKLKYRLVDKKISLAKLKNMAGITDYAMRQISKDKDVSTVVLTKICTTLNCEVQDIVEFLPDKVKNYDATLPTDKDYERSTGNDKPYSRITP